MSAIPPAAPASLPRSQNSPSSPTPNSHSINRRLRRFNIEPTPKILHALRKKQTLKSLRRSKKLNPAPIPDSQRQALEHEAHFRVVSAEYRHVRAALAGRPWEGPPSVDIRAIEAGGGGRLKGEYLEELSEILAERKGVRAQWLLDDDVEEEGAGGGERETKSVLMKQRLEDEEKIQLLVKRLSGTNLDMHDWQFSRLMKQSDLFFTEPYMLKIVDGLGALGNWKHALSVVEWVYNDKVYTHRKSRFVYTKLLAVLGKARRPSEALHIFNIMREDAQIYPDMAAYHNIAVTLGQAGLVKELTSIIECMRQKPSKRLKNMKPRNWDRCLEPDVIVYNAVLNACVPSHQWKGVRWVLEQMRHSGLKPTGATYGLAMEVMLQVGKYDLVYKFFEKMLKGGLAPKALTYKALVRAYWKEGRVDEAIKSVRDMEQRGVVGIASVYYELACCLCNHGRWQEAMIEVEKLKRLHLSKPLEVTFTGMILSSLDGGYISDCISIFEHMREHCTPNIGTINAMLKVYGRNDMFANARDLFESAKGAMVGLSDQLDDGISFKPDAYSYISMLEASAAAQQWDYFEYVYKEMALCKCQLNKKKHIWLLVEASRSGKGHLLEHAFDTILEAGEIPHISFFTEMICQTIAQQEFERSVCLVNNMAHASMQVSEVQWRNLFERNKGRFDDGNLQNLLDYFASSNLVAEDPIPSLLNSLRSLCGREGPKNILPLAAPDDVSGDSISSESENAAPDDVSGDSISSESENDVENHGEMRSFIPSRKSVDKSGNHRLSAEDPIFPVDNHSMEYEYLSEEVVDEPSSVLGDCSVNSIATSEVTDLVDCDLSDSFSKLPSAAEILESWREGRLSDSFNN